MPTHKYYYIRYLPKANVDYRVLFALAALAEYDTVNKSYSIIKYHSIDQLSRLLGKSTATINRILSYKDNYRDYEKFIQVDKESKTITLLNSFAKTVHVRYVSIQENVFNYLLKENDNFLIKYYLYMKYNYYLSNGKGIDNTAKQFLEACGYCATSGKYISKVSDCGMRLQLNSIMVYRKYFDEQARERHIYTVI